MTTEYLLGLVVLVLSLSWTPGPNNTLLAASAARFGYVRTLPHLIGTVGGFGVMIFLIGLGLSEVFQTYPLIREILRFVGAAILLWIAFKVATSPLPTGERRETDKPWTPARAAAFQWINPKGWMMAISLVGSAPQTSPTWLSPLIVAAVVMGIGATSANGWALFGKALQRFLSTPLRFRVFNFVMAALIVLTVVGILFADLSGKAAH
ncbi:MAG: lysine transporter LysE [Ponticaulis sp.]|nr:lysine transporter LysE [Ponticaulis sp.]